VFRAYGPGPSLWESVLPEMALRMPAELVRVDELLDDPAMLEPFRAFFDPCRGRRSIPMESYVRLMYLKYRYRLGFESLCREVTDSLSWSRFCRIPLGGSVPDHSTLKKIASRCGSKAIEDLNEALLGKAANKKVLKTDRVRADTTVVPADVGYPTDSGLLARGVVRMVALVAVLHGAGLAARSTMRDRSRSMRRRAHDMGAWLRRRSDAAKEEVKVINAEMADIAERALLEAVAVARNARRGLARRGKQAGGKAGAALAELEIVIARLDRVVAQSRLRLGGDMPEGASRLVSLHDPDARPIRKGRLGKPVEFGYLAQVVDNSDGVVLDHQVLIGNPPDGPLLAPAVARIKKLVGRAPRAVTADRGYGAASVDADVAALGVKTVAIVRKGRQSAARQIIERRAGFVKLIKWRTGSEGRISSLKRDFGWNRSLMDGLGGTQTWCGYGIFANNSIKISRLINNDITSSPATTPPTHPNRSPKQRPTPRSASPPTPSLTA